MHTANILVRNTVLLNPKLKSGPARLVRNFTRIASHNGKLQNSRLLSSYSGLGLHSRVCSYNNGLLPSVRQVSNIRLYSTDNKNDAPEEDHTVKDETPLFTSQLPATVAVPEVWPQVPVIAINRNPVFPRFIKLIEVSSLSSILLSFSYS